MNYRRVVKSADDFSVSQEEWILPGMPHGIAGVFHQRLGRTPAGKEVIGAAASFLKCGQLLRAHDAGGYRIRLSRAYEFDIHPDAFVMEGQAQIICRMAEVEGLFCAFWLSMSSVGELDFARWNMSAAGEFLAKYCADGGIIPAPPRSFRLFFCRQQLQDIIGGWQSGYSVQEIIHQIVIMRTVWVVVS